MNPVVFREYDIRGVYNSDFDKEFAYHLGRAFVTYVREKSGQAHPRLTLGHDARLSSPEVAKSLAEGFTASGAHVIHLGLVTSPISYFSTFTVPGVVGGIMVTGSHNPPEYNGFKISYDRTTIHGAEIKSLETIINDKRYFEGQGSEEKIDILTPYVERYKKEFGGMKPIPLVVDCGNGAAGSVVRRLYEAVGLSPVFMYEQPDGTFPNHHPDPTVEKNLTALKAEVKKTGARVGIGFDGDADRIGLVDENGRFILGDEMMALIAQDILLTSPGAKIIGDVKCSDRLYDFVKTLGGEPIMWKTGHSLIKEKVKTEKAPFGGELSGHIFFADRNYGYDDALYAGLRVIEILSKTGKTISQLLADLKPGFCTPEIRIDTTEEKKHSIVAMLKSKFADSSVDYKTNLIDGIRVSFRDGWALARASNTQPVLVLRFESTSQEGLNRIQNAFESVVNPLL
ncbi:MAG: phosphomannomutase/phosphoglucomutase [Bdellovibrionales bacterium]|nr:phosphomannomutase/phosphoglucomutase [Bdellovibrionales bacterium]